MTEYAIIRLSKSLRCRVQKVIITTANHRDIHLMVFSTIGLCSYKHDEVVLLLWLTKTVKKFLPSNDNEIFPPVKEYFLLLLKNAKNGKCVNELNWTICKFMEKFSGFLYSKQSLPKRVIKPENKFVIAVGVTEEELEYAKKFGTTRVLTLLGKSYRFYPTLAWLDVSKQRKSEIKEEMYDTILNNPTIEVPEVRARLTNDILKIEICKSSHKEIVSKIEKVKMKPFILRTIIDPRATSHLVFDGIETFEIHKPGESNLLGGSFCYFIPITNTIEKSKFEIKEDGFVIYLTISQLQIFFESITHKTYLNLVLNDKQRLTLNWIPDRHFSFYDPIQDKIFIVDNVYHEESILNKEKSIAEIESWYLISPDEDFLKRGSVHKYAEQIYEIKSAINLFFIKNFEMKLLNNELNLLVIHESKRTKFLIAQKEISKELKLIENHLNNLNFHLIEEIGPQLKYVIKFHFPSH